MKVMTRKSSFLASTLSFAIMLAAFCSQQIEARAAGNGGAIVVSAEQLSKDYAANRSAADSRYKGKTLRVTGIIDSLGEDDAHRLYLTFKGGGGRNIVQCTYAKSHESQLLGLSGNKSVTVTGVCEGKSGRVQLKDCGLAF
jgi:tRNA_anti-like